MPRSRQLTVELLEARHLPSVFGMPWSDAERLSLSFALDSTSIESQSSALFQSFNATMSTSAWQTEILRAFQTWAVQANLNVGIVSDGGQAFGTQGAVQADARFGDFRIGGRALPDHFATNTPFNLLSGSRAGDIVFNTGALFGINDPAKKDLFTAALNEAGNALGLIDSDIPASALYGNYNGIKTGLTAADIAALRVLYPLRQADANEGTTGNESFATATALTPGVQAGDITTLIDADVFQFTVPEGTSVISLRVQTGGISLLASKLTLYDGNQNVISSTATTDPLTGQLVLELSNPVAGGTYYAKVESGNQSVFGIGAYRLRLHLAAASTMPAEQANNVVAEGALRDDAHADDALATATNLNQSVSQTDLRFDYRLQGKIRADTTDVDFYRLTSPTAPTGKSNTLVAMVRGLDAELYSKVSVYDSAGSPVTTEVLANNQGAYTVQVKNAASDATYYIKVEAASPSNHSAGDYALGVDFRTDSTVLDAAASGTLSSTSLESFTTLTNYESQLFHFSLPASAATVNTAIRMTIYNSSNQVVKSVISINGEALSTSIFLTAGTYTFRFEGGAQNNAALPAIAFNLRGLRISDPIDPLPIDPTDDPPAAADPTFIFGTTAVATSQAISQVDPYSNPWDDIFGF